MKTIKASMIRTTKNSGPAPLFFVGVLILLLLTACQPQPTEKHLTFSGPIMGTDYRISMLVTLDTDLNALEESVLRVMQSVDQSMSTYIEDSELNQFNRTESGIAVRLSSELAEVMREAIIISRLSDGAFDVTLAQAINLWGFGPQGRVSKQPNQQQLNEIKRSVGYEKLKLDGDLLSKADSDLSIDLSAIAKGYAVDKVAEILLQSNITNFLVSIGGELRAAGRKLDGSVWQVGIEKPQVLGGIQEIVALDGKAVATSGDYRNYYTINGKQFSHTIDPISLTPVFHQLALVSVIADSAMRADALATAMLAMGEVRAQEFAKLNDLAAYMIIREAHENQYRIVVTDRFRSVLQ